MSGSYTDLAVRIRGHDGYQFQYTDMGKARAAAEALVKQASGLRARAEKLERDSDRILVEVERVERNYEARREAKKAVRG